VQKGRLKQSRSVDLFRVGAAYEDAVYLFDPSGHRLELAAWTTAPEKQGKLKSVAQDMINE
jgi:hypothetical protein